MAKRPAAGDFFAGRGGFPQDNPRELWKDAADAPASAVELYNAKRGRMPKADIRPIAVRCMQAVKRIHAPVYRAIDSRLIIHDPANRGIGLCQPLNSAGFLREHLRFKPGALEKPNRPKDFGVKERLHQPGISQSRTPEK